MGVVTEVRYRPVVGGYEVRDAEGNHTRVRHSRAVAAMGAGGNHLALAIAHPDHWVYVRRSR